MKFFLRFASLLLLQFCFIYPVLLAQTPDSWSQKSDFGGSGRTLAAGFSIGKKGYIGTGLNGASTLSDFWEYDPQSDTWSQKANYGGGNRYGAFGFSIGNKGYIGGGAVSSGGTGALISFWEYDVEGNVWTQKANANRAMFGGVGIVQGGKGYVASGSINSYNVPLPNSGLIRIDNNQLAGYDPLTDTWTTLTPMPVGYSPIGPFGFGLNGKIYVGGGSSDRSGTIPYNKFYEYNPSSNSWTAKADIPVNSFLSPTFVVGNKGYVGLAGSWGNANQLYEYNDLTNSWTLKASYPTGNRDGGVGFSIGNKGYIGTGSSSKSFYQYTPSESLTPATALKFDPSLTPNDNSRLNYVSVDNPFRGFQKEMTVEFWMYVPNANLPFGSLMGQGTSNVDNNWVWLMHPEDNGTMNFYVNDGGTLRSTNCSITAGAWHHYAATASATSTKFYIDGALVHTGAGVSGNILSNPSSVIHIGKDVRYATRNIANGDPWNRYATMTLDEVRIWSRALCEDEIRHNKNVEINPAVQTGLQHYYSFNQGFVNANNPGESILYDLSGNNRNGVLNNFTLYGTSSNWVASGFTSIGTYTPYNNSAAPITGQNKICIGTSTTLSNANSGGKWMSSNTAIATINEVTGLVTPVSPGSTTITYTTSCGLSSTMTIYVNLPPSLGISGTNIICSGGSTVLTGMGPVGTTYSWSTGATTSSITVAPNATTTYLVTGTNIDGCSAQVSRTVTVNTAPTVTVSGTNTICSGTTTTLTASGATGTTYLWNTGAVTASINVSPTATTTYTVTATDAGGCTAQASSTVTVNAVPIAGISGTNTICSGRSTTLIATGGGGGTTYSWNTGATTFAISVAPAVTTTYTVTLTNAAGCTSQASRIVTVNSIPTVTASSNSPVTIGTDLELSANGANTYVWSGPNGFSSTAQNPVINNITSVASGSYTVTGTSIVGCTNTATVNVTVLSTPATALKTDGVDDHVTISNPFRSFGKAITVEFWMNSPTGILAQGSVMGQSSLNVDGMATDVWLMHPDIGRTKIDFYVNDAETWRRVTVPIRVGGWHHYVGVASEFGTKFYVDGVLEATGPGISTGILNNANSIIQIGKDPRHTNLRFADMSIDEVRIWSRALCEDEIINNKNCELNPAGQNGLQEYYRFNQGFVGANNSTETTLTDLSGNNRHGTLSGFALTGNNSNWVQSGFVSTANCSPYVAPTAPISGNISLCIGSNTTLTNANVGGRWTSSNTGVATINNTTGQVTTVSVGTTTITYTTECGGVSTATLTVNALPVASVAGTNTICSGGSTILTASGGATYLWNTGATTPFINVSPTVTTTYTVTATNAAGCTSQASRTVTVNASPTAAVIGMNIICSGSSTTLTASGGGTYSWNTGATTAAITVSPAVTTTYTVTATNAVGCTAQASRVVTVNANPIVTASSNSPVAIGNDLQLSASGANTYVWSGPNGFNSTAQNPVINNITSAANGTYTVIGTSSLGCTNTASINVSILSDPATALKTDGVDDYVLISNPYSAFNKNITVEFWMNTPNAIMPFGSVMGQATSGVDDMSTNVWLMHPNTAGGIDFLVNDAGTWRGVTVPIKAGGWHHYVGVASEFGTKFYVDGVLEATGPAITTGIVNNENSVIHIGKDVRHNMGRFGEISVDEVRIWSRVLCEGEINNSKNCELNPSGLMGLQQYYRFNQGYVAANNSQQTTLIDASGNGRDGQLNNFALTGTNSNWIASGSTNNGTCSNYVPPTAPITGTTYICIGSTSTLSNAIPGGLWSSSNPSVATINANTGLVTSISGGVTTITYKNECGGISTTTVSTPTLPTPTITTPVGGTNVCPGNTVTLSAPSGFGLSYQWYKDGVEIPGATSSNYTATVSGTYTLARTSIPCSSPQSSPVTVTIADNVKPTVICPPNQTINLDASCKATLPDYRSLLTISDNCTATGSLIVTQSPAAGSEVNSTGTMLVTFTVKDAAGNESTCSITVEKKDVIAPVITCLANITVTATSAAGAVVNYVAPVGTDNCSGATTVRTAGLASGSTFPIGTTTVTYRVTDAAGLSSECSFTITVVGVVPVITCPDNITMNAAAGTCAANVNFAATETVGIPTSTIIYTINENPVVSGASFPVGTTTVVATATNAVGSSSCSFTVTVVDNQNPTITAPENVQANNSAGLCTGTVTLGIPVTADNCGVASVTNDAPVTGIFPVGSTTVTWTVTDIHGNKAAATQTVVIVDNEKPTISVTNVSVNNDAGKCGATVSIAQPETADNCGVASVAGVRSDNASLSADYPVGTTTITWTVTDIHGNHATTTQTIVVNDTELPVVKTKNIVVQLGANGQASITTSQINNGSTDNCGIATLVLDQLNFNCSNVGVNTLLLTVTDIHGNSASANATVTVQDNILPTVITRPVTVTLVNGAASITAAQVNNGSFDNCGIATITVSPASFNCNNIGSNTVILTVTDVNGNTKTGSAIVTVVGQLPSCSITSVPTSNVFTGGNPNNIYLGYGAQSTVLNVAATGGSSYTYQWSGTATQMLSSTTAAAPVFTPTAPGNYTFTVTVTNNFGCTSTCSITICVKDIRVPGTGLKGSPAKVYICHLPPGNKSNPQTLEISVNAVATHIGQHSGDRLGTCAMTPCAEPTPTVVANALVSKAVVEAESKTNTQEELKVTVMPNPTKTYFTLKIESKYDAPVNMRVMDALGRIIDIKAKLGSNATVEIGHNYNTGSYFAEFIQGNRRKVVQLLKVK